MSVSVELSSSLKVYFGFTEESLPAESTESISASALFAMLLSRALLLQPGICCCRSTLNNAVWTQRYSLYARSLNRWRRMDCKFTKSCHTGWSSLFTLSYRCTMSKQLSTLSVRSNSLTLMQLLTLFMWLMDSSLMAARHRGDHMLFSN